MYRKLNIKDAFKFARIVKKAGLKDIVSKFAIEAEKAATTAENKDELATKYGLDFVVAIIEGISDSEIEKEIYDFFAGVSGMKAEDVAEMGLVDFADMVKAIFTENNIADFFTQSLPPQK